MAIGLGRSAAADAKDFALFVARRFAANRLTEVAASLTFTTLLALVPLMAVAFSVIAAFPAFNGMEAQLEGFIFDNFVPEASSSVRDYLATFRANAGKLSAVGIIGLVITAVMVLMTIERALNRVFHVMRPRSLIIRVLTYFALLIAGPLLFVTSLTMTSAIVANAAAAGGEHVGMAVNQMVRLAPLALSFGGYLALYTLMPNRRVSLAHAAAGAGFAALLFEALKSLFGLYITAFPTYQAIYGAISVLPILLLWIYLSWIVTLAGAGIVAGLPEWLGRYGIDLVNAPRSGRLAMAVEMLRLLRRAHLDGESVRAQAFVRGLRMPPHVLEDMLALLERAGYAAETRRGRWVLCRDLHDRSLYDLVVALGLHTRQPMLRGQPVPGLAPHIAAAIEGEHAALGVPLLDVLMAEAGSGPRPVVQR